MPDEQLAVFAAAALLLSLERVCYVWIVRRPAQFRARMAAVTIDPIAGVRLLFAVFKVIQAGVFAGWCLVFGQGLWWTPQPGPAVVTAAVALIAGGQVLNVAVFNRLGSTGVFYGTRFGHDLPWSRTFPFSWFDHPQYVGTVATIWGVFLLARFPHGDWFVLPALETLYYSVGARLETGEAGQTARELP